MKAIKQSVINTFNRVGIDYENLDNEKKEVEVHNRFGFGTALTTELIAKCISWVYATSDDYENGIRKVNVSDFDRVRYFVVEQDQEAYMTCLD